jgi:hypothetical protein
MAMQRDFDRPAAKRRFKRDLGWSIVLWVCWSLLADVFLKTPLASALAFGLAFLGLFPAAFVIVYLVGLSVPVVYGFSAARAGFVVGTLGFAAALLLAVVAWNGYVVFRLTRFATRDLQEPSQAHTVLAFDNTSLESPLQTKVLALSSYAVAYGGPVQRERKMGWDVYRRASGERCFEDANAKSALEFAKAGFPGLCAVRSIEPTPSDALIYREWYAGTGEHRTDSPWTIPSRSPVFEMIERIDGHDRLLGREVIAQAHDFNLGTLIGMTLGFAIDGHRLYRGPDLDKRVFLARLLKVPRTALDAPGPNSPRQSLDAIEPYFDQPKSAAMASVAWWQIAEREAVKNPDMLRPSIARFLVSENPARVAAAINLLFSMPAADRQTATDRVMQVALGPMLSGKDTLLTNPIRAFLDLRRRTEPFSPQVRARAEARLRSDDTLSDDARGIMYAIVACCSVEARREAFDAMLALKGQAFEETVRDIGNRNDLWVRNTQRGWTQEEIERLIERASDVPDSRLAPYLYAFRRQASAAQKVALLALIRDRLNALESAPVRDVNQIRQFRQMIEDISKNYG